MGYGEYSHAAHVAITRQRAAAPASSGRAVALHPGLDPNGARREARDSDEHPASLGVVFALDVTGSMGDIPRDLATRTLPTFMAALLAARVPDPQVCFMAVGHATDRAPLQVGQFESAAALIDAWLARLWIEGGGVGQHEAYELAMYFAAHHMALDSVERRGQRGFFFLTADVAPNPAVSRTQAARVLGVTLEQDLPIRQLITDLQRRFEPFVLLAPGTRAAAERAWRELFGDRVVRMERAGDAAQLAAGLVSLLQGAVPTVHGLARRLEAQGLERRAVARIVRALVPFAASVGRDGAPLPPRGAVTLPRGDPPSGLERP